MFLLQLTVTMSKAFLHYIHHYPIMFELFGHYQPNHVHEGLKENGMGMRRSPSV